MKRLTASILLAAMLLAMSCAGGARKSPLDKHLPMRGFLISAPGPDELDSFLSFIYNDLTYSGFNLLILMVNWNYEYESHPELRDWNPLSKQDVARIVKACKVNGIRLVPYLNLLGHQSWHKETKPLLREYPQFDETPSISSESYDGWPNEYGLYCKSYCPLHPDIHDVLFPMIDELCDAFEADALHAGMDEVFYIGMDECPRCKGHDPAELLAGEITLLRNHLAEKGRELMIWGDRLLDGELTGLGEWEASLNGTAGAIDLIPHDVFICDWHYEKPDTTELYFASKGFNVLESGYRDPDISERQIFDLIRFRRQSPGKVSKHIAGYLHCIWSSWAEFSANYDAIMRLKLAGRTINNRYDNHDIGEVEAYIRVCELFRRLDE